MDAIKSLIQSSIFSTNEEILESSISSDSIRFSESSILSDESTVDYDESFLLSFNAFHL